jgi:hypothetical protein
MLSKLRFLLYSTISFPESKNMSTFVNYGAIGKKTKTKKQIEEYSAIFSSLKFPRFYPSLLEEPLN